VSIFIYRLVVSGSAGRTRFVDGEPLYDVGYFEFRILNCRRRERVAENREHSSKSEVLNSRRGVDKI
jgi:hypothetical protein